MAKAIKVFVGEHCQPCHEVADLIKQGRASEDVELVDIETDEGFLDFTETVLKERDGAVPSAFREGKQCRILITDDNFIEFACETPAPPVAPED